MSFRFPTIGNIYNTRYPQMMKRDAGHNKLYLDYLKGDNIPHVVGKKASELRREFGLGENDIILEHRIIYV